MDKLLSHHCGPYIMWRVAFRIEDLACVPTRSDGKFRLYRCRVIEQVNIDV